MAGFFGFFDFTKPGRGVSKEETVGHPAQVFFQVLGRKWTKFVQLNLLYFVFMLPLIFVLFLFAPLLQSEEPQAILDLYLYEIFSLNYIAVVGIAPLTVGFSYILRNYSREHHAFIWSDFIDQIKENWRKSLLLLLIDIVVVVLVTVSYRFYTQIAADNLIFTVCRWFVVVAAVIYFMMHFYIYQLMVTFDMSFKIIMKNSFMLTLAKLPFNLLLLLACIVVSGLVFFSPILGVLFCAIFAIALIGYIVNFYVNNVIYKILIEPQLAKSEYESDFIDKG